MEKRNEIITGEGNDQILILDGLKAERGINRISSGDGDDRIVIGDDIKASKGGINIIETGTGNDYIELYDKVERGALRINAGEGYDTLVLHSRNAGDFSSDYRNWLTDLANQGDLASSNLEAIQIDINSRFNLNQIDWLTQLINRHNDINPDAKIDLTLNLDDNGSVIHLDDIFTRANESAITGIDLSGGHKNMLYIGGSLAANGYDGSILKITGDGHDRVVLDQSWQRSDSDFVDELGISYNIYSNNAADEVLIQAGMNTGIV